MGPDEPGNAPDSGTATPDTASAPSATTAPVSTERPEEQPLTPDESPAGERSDGAAEPGTGEPRRRRRRRRGRRGAARREGAATQPDAPGTPPDAAAMPPDGPAGGAGSPPPPASPPRREDPRRRRARDREGRRRSRAGARPPHEEAPAPPPPPRGQPDLIPRTPRGAGIGDRDRGRTGGRGERRPPAGAPVRPAPPVVPAVSHLADAAPSGEPLGPDEIAEMKEHLAFLREYKDVLRIRLNAAEDLMVNGRREPSDRGICRHLLGKVDRTVVEAAIAREPLKSNFAARARMLAGAIRLTADVGVLLAWLETLAPARSHADAARAFAEVVRRIDFASLSPTRLARLLQVLTETFGGHERVQVLFSLLDGDVFRRAFDAAEPTLPADVAAVLAPLRAVHRRLRSEGEAGREPGAAAARLAAGLEQVLAAPDPVLRGYAEPLRVRLLELALDPAIPPELADRAAGVLLTSLAKGRPETGRTFRRLAMRRAAQLLARHVDDRARATLAEVTRAAPGYHAAERWLAALDARRMGRTALTAPPPERGRLAAAFWLDGQQPVWIRTAPAADADTLDREAALQAALALPGIAPVVEHGVASGIPYVTVEAAGRPWTLGADADAATALTLAAQAARILRALALAGVALPDAAPERFCAGGERTPMLVLADLAGARGVAREEAEAVTAASAAVLVHRLLPHAELPTGDLAALVDALDRLRLAPGTS